jgi:hypothetical protein
MMTAANRARFEASGRRSARADRRGEAVDGGPLTLPRRAPAMPLTTTTLPPEGTTRPLAVIGDRHPRTSFHRQDTAMPRRAAALSLILLR